LSTFYPFARNHYNYTDESGEALPPQEVYNLEFPYNETAKSAINQRYSFLRYFYTNFFEIHKNGGTMVRPLFFAFPDDEDTLEGMEHSFMVGDALKITPVLSPQSEHKGKIKSYFPKNSRFISLNDFSTIIDEPKGNNHTLETSLNYTIVHMKEGTIIPWQNTTEHYYPRTYNLIKDRGLDILIFPDKNGFAKGSLFIDQTGDNLNQFEFKHYEYYELTYSNKTLKIRLADGLGAEGNIEDGNHIIKDVFVLGQKLETTDHLSACAFSTEMVPEDIQITYDPMKMYIKINVTNSNTLTFNEIMAIQYTTSPNDASYCHPKYVVESVALESKYFTKG
jgi:alpha-glucosidase (family GH31 glycosyl hydrolase)